MWCSGRPRQPLGWGSRIGGPRCSKGRWRDAGRVRRTDAVVVASCEGFLHLGRRLRAAWLQARAGHVQHMVCVQPVASRDERPRACRRRRAAPRHDRAALLTEPRPSGAVEHALDAAVRRLEAAKARLRAWFRQLKTSRRRKEPPSAGMTVAPAASRAASTAPSARSDRGSDFEMRISPRIR